MSARIFAAARSPISTGLLAGKRAPAPLRFNSSSSASSAARLVEMASRAEKPSPMEAAVPVMWVVSGALIWTAFNRAETRRGEDHVEKLLIV